MVAVLNLGYITLMHSKLMAHTEFCYNFQYIEKNARVKGDPWSLRQSGVYQKFFQGTNRSIWIILSPSSGVPTQIEKLLRSYAVADLQCGQAAVYVHVIFISLMTNNWQEYLEDLHRHLLILVSISPELINIFIRR